jgi:hypothetical protein
VKATDTIRLLTATTNEKGDLFTRLMDDFFKALGYDDIRHDVAKPGREVDVHATHRTEDRQMRAECKAHASKMGGDEIGKFRGALLAEQIEAGKQKIEGYFVSLGGFRESAIEQEKKLGRKGIILVAPPRIIKELESSKAIPTDARAIDQASRSVQLADLPDIIADGIELLGHEMGYVKVVYYTLNGQRTHFALVDANGFLLAPLLAYEIMAADTACGGQLVHLEYLPPAKAAPSMHELEEQAMVFYRAWISRECGFLQLDGLPIDGRLDKKLQLEKLFVPLKIKLFKAASGSKSIVGNAGPPEPEALRLPPQAVSEKGEPIGLAIGEALNLTNHLALLATPGSGKSTLLKRLATAYAFAERRTEVDDKLPEQQWLPIFLRCRGLREDTHKSILDLLDGLPQKISMPHEEAVGFRRVLHRELRLGNVLLLVDGLDEIWNEGDRKRLSFNLHTFIEAHSRVKVVVTSREAGFRAVGGVVSEVCHLARIEPLDDDGIDFLCTQWHDEVYGKSEAVQRDATKLTKDIFSNRNVLALARNPLLLTTLLVVKRSIGELPTNRAALYGAAVQLLVKTWNIEGFNALNERETFSQLCYVACTMTERGNKQISHSALIDLLLEAREVLAAELQHTRLSPEEFITQVEHRSSLLMMIGYAKTQGELQPQYEFRHLTFQEYLAARGYVRNLHSRRREKLSLVELLEPHFTDDSWQEIIRLAAVLAEIDAEPLIERLNELCAETETDEVPSNYDDNNEVSLLGKCILDEVIIHPKVLRESLKQLARFAGSQSIKYGILGHILSGRSESLLVQTIEEEYFSGQGRWEEYARAVKELCCTEYSYFVRASDIENPWQELQQIEVHLARGTREEGAKAALEFVSVAYRHHMDTDYSKPLEAQYWMPPAKLRANLFSHFKAMIASDDLPSVYAGAWAMAIGLKELGLLDTPTPDPAFILLLLRNWCAASSLEMSRMLALVLVAQPLVSRDALQQANVYETGYAAFLVELAELYYNDMLERDGMNAVILTAWYLRGPWSEAELVRLIEQTYWAGKSATYNSPPNWPVATRARLLTMLQSFELLDSSHIELRDLMIGQLNEVPPSKEKEVPTYRTYSIASDDSDDLPF